MTALLLGIFGCVLYLAVIDPALLLAPISVASTLLFVQLVVLSALSSLCLIQRTGCASPALLPWTLPIVAAFWGALYSALAVRWAPEGLLFSLETQRFEWIVRNAALLTLAALPVSYGLFLRDRWMGQLAAESGARLETLQARIRPHFLFNALNTIASLIHDRPDRAEQASLDLADLLRTGLKSDEAHSLEDELELIRRYLRLEALRLEERLTIDWQLAEDLPLTQTFPPLLLQPLVENAIVHGISRRTEGGTVAIRAERIRFARIRFTITNPLADPGSGSSDGNRSALENIRQRLALAYEERYGLKTWTEDGQFKAELTIPVT